MSHIRESFPILEDATTLAGVALHKSENGDASAGKVGMTAWVFKDKDGYLVHPQLNNEGAIVVSSEGAGTPKNATSGGEVVGALTLTTICEVALTAAKTVGKISVQGACFREAIFYLIALDDATEVIITSFIVGSGQYSHTIPMGEYEFVTGATGTQKLILKAKNLSKASDFLGSFSAIEFAG